jgi:small subunit ribosomal protein S1
MSDPWEDIPTRYRVGDRVKGKVTNTTDFGAFVELEPDIEGLIHVSELSREKVEHPSDVVTVGDTVEAVVIHVDRRERRIGLSIKNLKEWDEKEAYDRYLSQQSSTGSSLGELIQREMEKKSMEEQQNPEKGADDSEDKSQEPV